MKKEESFLPEEPLFQGKFFDPNTRKILSEFSEALRPDKPEVPKELITQRSKYVGYFCPLVKTEEPVRRGQKIGFIRIKGLKKEEFIEAEADGVIKEILPAYEITDAEGSEPQKDRTLTSVEYGQALFIIESEKLSSSKVDK